MLKNAAHHDDRLIGANSDVAKKAEIHGHKMNDAGVMKMVHVKDGLEVPGMGRVTLKPGSYHVMLMGLKAPLKEGETFKLELTFEKAGRITVPVKVMGVAAKGMKMDHSGHGESHNAMPAEMNPDDYRVDHNTHVSLVNPQGELAAVIRPPIRGEVMRRLYPQLVTTD